MDPGGDRVRAMVTQLGMPQGIVALFARPPRATPEQLRRAATRVIAVEAVDNPINIGSIIRNAVAALEKIDGVTKANVRLVMSPPWSPDRMTDEARDQLGFF